MPSKHILALALASILLEGSAAHAASGHISLHSDHMRRSAILVEYQRLKRGRRPTLIVLQGDGPGGVARVRGALGLDQAARTSGVAVVYAEPIDGRWRGLAPGKGRIDDAAFIKRLAAKLVSDGVADQRRIFLAGVGTGGMLALRLGCDSADLFAGVAAIDAELPQPMAAACKPSRPLPLLLMNGVADPQIPWQGGKFARAGYKLDLVSTDATLAPFVKAAGCTDAAPSQTALPHHDQKDPTRVVLERYAGCKAPVELFRIEGGGHTVPGRKSLLRRGAGSSPLGQQNHDIRAGRVVAEFFRSRLL